MRSTFMLAVNVPGAVLTVVVFASAAALTFGVSAGNSRAVPAATADVRHGFDMRQLPYPHGVLYTVAVARASGPVPRLRRSWSRFSSDASYTGGLAGNTKLGTLTLRPGSYVISGSTRPITDTRAGSSTLGPPEARCTRSIEIAAAAQTRIVVFAKSGRPCSIKVTTG